MKDQKNQVKRLLKNSVLRKNSVLKNSIKNSITAGIIIHNEEKTLERCLKSLVGFVNEIIVIHDGSCQDNSLVIAKKYTDKVYVRKKFGCCEGHFDFLKKISKSEWLLLIDGDEYLSKELSKKLKSLTNAENVSAYEICWPTIYGNKQLMLGFDRRFYKRVLFRTSKVTFESFPHGAREVDGKVLKVQEPLIHKPVNDIFSKSYLDKKISWAPITAKIIFENRQSQGAFFYFVKSFVWFAFYFCYNYIIRCYFASGAVGWRYSIFYARYNFMINWNLYKLALNSKK